MGKHFSLKHMFDDRVVSLVGNFNSMRTMEERRDVNNVVVGGRDMVLFNSYIDELELMDIPLVWK